jgi:RimJ/RimL family protein N-acetyltransferase
MENELFLLRIPNKKTDVLDLLKIKNNTETSKYLGGNTPVYSKTDINNWIEFHNNCENESLFIIQDKQNNKVIGHIGLYNIDLNIKSAEYAILIGDNEYLGRGVGKQMTNLILEYGFYKLNLNRIYLSLIKENLAALNLYNKMGFKNEGCLRQVILKKGIYYDSVLMAILKSEYDEK